MSASPAEPLRAVDTDADSGVAGDTETTTVIRTIDAPLPPYAQQDGRYPTVPMSPSAPDAAAAAAAADAAADGAARRARPGRQRRTRS